MAPIDVSLFSWPFLMRLSLYRHSKFAQTPEFHPFLIAPRPISELRIQPPVALTLKGHSTRRMSHGDSSRRLAASHESPGSFFFFLGSQNSLLAFSPPCACRVFPLTSGRRFVRPEFLLRILYPALSRCPPSWSYRVFPMDRATFLCLTAVASDAPLHFVPFDHSGLSPLR